MANHVYVGMPILAYVGAAYGDPDANPALDDVRMRLENIDGKTSHGVFFDPDIVLRLRSHIQGVTRLPVPGRKPWFVMTRNNDDAQLAGFLFVEFPLSSSDGGSFDDAAQPGGPGVGKLRRFWGRNRSEHPGGLQACGRLLAVAEDPADGTKSAYVAFVDARDPTQPSFLATLTLDGSHKELPSTGLTCAGLARLEDQHYLLATYRYAGDDTGTLQLFLSTTPFLNANTGWTCLSTLRKGSGLPDTFVSEMENFNLLAQRDGSLFFAALRGNSTDNHVDLYRIDPDAKNLAFVTTKPIRTLLARGTLRAGGCLYITPSGELALYVVQKTGGGTFRDMMIEEFTP